MTDAADEQAAWLTQIRRSGISVDREGRFIHEGAEVAHEGLKRALFRWLDRLPPPDGRYVLRLDERRFAYLEDVADTPLVARAARIDPAGDVRLALSDGSEEPLDPGDADRRRRRRAARLGARRPPGGAARHLRRRRARRPHHRGRRSSASCGSRASRSSPASVGKVTTKRAPPSGERLIVDVDVAAVVEDDLAHDRQPQPGAVLLAGDVGIEDPLAALGRYAGAVVVDGQTRAAFGRAGRHGDADLAACDRRPRRPARRSRPGWPARPQQHPVAQRADVPVARRPSGTRCHSGMGAREVLDDLRQIDAAPAPPWAAWRTPKNRRPGGGWRRPPRSGSPARSPAGAGSRRRRRGTSRPAPARRAGSASAGS